MKQTTNDGKGGTTQHNMQTALAMPLPSGGGGQKTVDMHQ